MTLYLERHLQLGWGSKCRRGHSLRVMMKLWKENSREPDRFGLHVLLTTHAVNPSQWQTCEMCACAHTLSSWVSGSSFMHVYILCIPGRLDPALHMCTPWIAGRLGLALYVWTFWLHGVPVSSFVHVYTLYSWVSRSSFVHVYTLYSWVTSRACVYPVFLGDFSRMYISCIPGYLAPA